MLEKLDVIRMAKAMNAHAALRQSLVSRNVANADTPGYRARDLSAFEEVWRQDAAQPLRATRPGHLGASAQSGGARIVTDDSGGMSPNGNSVSLENEMLRAADIRREYDLSLTIYKSGLGIMRTSLGRR